jgi:hypothetical protein
MEKSRKWQDVEITRGGLEILGGGLKVSAEWRKLLGGS